VCRGQVVSTCCQLASSCSSSGGNEHCPWQREQLVACVVFMMCHVWQQQGMGLCAVELLLCETLAAVVLMAVWADGTPADRLLWPPAL
jgi:hypothetical protein